MATIERDGVEIYYEAQGSGPAVLLSHGYGATSQMWAGQLPALATEWRVIAWDMRGHGRTDSPEDPSLIQRGGDGGGYGGDSGCGGRGSRR